MSENTGFTVTKELSKHNVPIPIYVFTFNQEFSEKHFLEFLALLDKLLKQIKPFFMLINTQSCKHIPIKSSILLISWMRNRRSEIKDTLLGSSVVVTSSKVASLINSAFKISRPIRPNKITTTYENAYLFLNEISLA